MRRCRWTKFSKSWKRNSPLLRSLRRFLSWSWRDGFGRCRGRITCVWSDFPTGADAGGIGVAGLFRGSFLILKANLFGLARGLGSFLQFCLGGWLFLSEAREAVWRFRRWGATVFADIGPNDDERLSGRIGYERSMETARSSGSPLAGVKGRR